MEYRISVEGYTGFITTDREAAIDSMILPKAVRINLIRDAEVDGIAKYAEYTVRTVGTFYPPPVDEPA